MCQIHSVEDIPFCFFIIPFTIIFHSTPRASNSCLYFPFHQQHPVRISFLPHIRYTPSPFHPHYYPHYKIFSSLLLLPASYTDCCPYHSQYLSSPYLREKFSHPYTTKGLILRQILCIVATYSCILYLQ